jgi:Domain of unknown function (DUF4129)
MFALCSTRESLRAVFAAAAPLCLCALSVWAGSLGAQSPSPPPLSLAQYQAELHRLEAAIEEQRDHFQPPAGQSESLHLSLPSAWIVEADGHRYEVPTAGIALKIGNGQDRAAAFAHCLGQVRALEQAANQFAARGFTPNAASADTRLQEILSRREFRASQQKKSWIAELWDTLIAWLYELLDRLFSGVSKSTRVRNTVLYGVILGGFVALAGGLVRLLRGVAGAERLHLPAAERLVKTSSQWAREALHAAARGDYRDAIHCGYWAGVYRLGEAGAWELDPSRTPREYLRLLTAPAGSANEAGEALALADPALRRVRAQALDELTRNFEAAWYAHLPVTQHDFSSAVANLEKLECRLPSIAPTAAS